jgi:site-specific DNA recombinase
VKAIAKQLNADSAPSPRAQCGRSQSWAPSSVRAVLHRPLYRGEIVWAQTAKRDQWGGKRQASRPEADWIRRPAPALRIVSDDEWNAAHARQAAARKVYMKTNGGQVFGRPPLANPSRHLLTNLALCGCCGGTLYVLSRSHGAHRKRFYGCSGFHERGICGNRADVPRGDADEILIEALLDDVLDDGLLGDSVDEALRLLQGNNPADRIAAVEREIGTVEQERNRLVTAIATGGQLDGLLLAAAGARSAEAGAGVPPGTDAV